jgi:hypothetical protein
MDQRQAHVKVGVAGVSRIAEARKLEQPSNDRELAVYVLVVIGIFVIGSVFLYLIFATTHS